MERIGIEIGVDRIKPVGQPWCDKWFYEIVSGNKCLNTSGGFETAEEALAEAWPEMEKLLLKGEGQCQQASS